MTEKKSDPFVVAMKLAEDLYAVNDNQLTETERDWLKSESAMDTSSPASPAADIIRSLYEGIFKAVEEGADPGPESLWAQAQQQILKPPKESGLPGNAPGNLRRILRFYWMVRFAANDLTEKYPNRRLGKVLLNMEHDLREAFVEFPDDIKVPLATRRKTQWDLLAEYGLGLTVDQIYNLEPRRRPVVLNIGNRFWVGVVCGVILGLIIAVILGGG